MYCFYRNSDTSSKVGVAKQAGGFALDTSASGDYSAPVAQAADSGPVSRGYREKSSIGRIAFATLMRRTNRVATQRWRWEMLLSLWEPTLR